MYVNIVSLGLSRARVWYLMICDNERRPRLGNPEEVLLVRQCLLQLLEIRMGSMKLIERTSDARVTGPVWLV